MGGLTGGGALKQAALCDALLNSWKYGASLDFRQCFETLDVPFVKAALLKGLPRNLWPWINVTCNQWLSTRRWIVYDHHSCGQPKTHITGIPQGDSASPLVLALVLAFGCEQVEALGPRSRLHLAVYMDDRTIISDSQPLLEDAIQTWTRYASYLHLLESPAKTQRCYLDDPSQPSSMEVLGVLIGQPSRDDYLRHMKHSKRFQAAEATARRVALLPISQQKKLEAMGVHSRTQVTYGWLAGRPPAKLAQKYNTMLWRCLGRLSFGVPQLKSLVGGAHMELRQSTLLQQLHVLVRRDATLRSLGLEPPRSALNQMVEDQLIEFGWYKTLSGWEHTVLSKSFNLDDVQVKEKWKLISHDIRQSFRWFEYTKMQQSTRREFRGCNLPPWDEARVDLVRKWARKTPGAFPVVTGSIPSLKTKSIAFGSHQLCALCGTQDPSWDHTWTCGLRMDPPTDTLLRRFLWMRTIEDADLCNSFRTALDLIRGNN
eukprot:Skav231413  [mRNA]  locus=scaffold4039:114460:115917:- [translate_table: standard]